MRDNFSSKTKEILAKRVGYICSFCRRPTSGPSLKADASVNIGTAAHITAAAEGGPRYKASLTHEQRRHHSNGIWLCNLCSTLIDKDEAKYTIQLLEKWKEDAERDASFALEKGNVQTQAVLNLEENTINNVQPILKSSSNDLNTIINNPEINQIYGLLSTINDGINEEHQHELDHSRKLIEKNNPLQAIEFLTNFDERIKQKASLITKFRIVTNLASAQLAIGENLLASDLFLEAEEYNPSDEKALCNCALAYLIKNNSKKVKEYVAKVLDVNSKNVRAISYLIQSSSKSVPLSKVKKIIPLDLELDAEINLALAIHSLKQSNFKKAIEFLSVAICNDTTSNADLHALLGNTILFSLSKNNLLMQSIEMNEDDLNQLDKSISELTIAWDIFKDTDLKKYKTEIILNRSVANKVKGDMLSAIKDIDAVLDIYPDNINYLKNKAFLVGLKGDYPESIQLLQSIEASNEFNDGYILLADAYKKNNETENAIMTLESALKTSEDNNERSILNECKRELINLYLEHSFENLDRANALIAELRGENPEEILNIISLSNIYRHEEKIPDAISLLLEAKALITDSSTIRSLYELANELYELEQFSDAAEVYESFVNTGIYSPLTNRVADCYYRGRLFGKVIGICEKLRIKNEYLGELTRLEIGSYIGLGCLDMARFITESYLKTNSDVGLQIQLAIINHRLNDPESVDKFLNSEIDVEGLSFESGNKLAYLYSARSMNMKMLNVTYEMRRRFSDKAEAHGSYISFFIGREQEDTLTVNIVEKDTAVTFQDDSKHTSTYIIESRNDSKIQQGEISMNHELSKRLLGLRVGDKIKKNENAYITEEITITEVVSKYVYAFRDSLDNFSSRFPNEKGVWKVAIDESLEESKENALNQLLKTVDDRNRKVEIIISFYKADKCTLGMISRFLSISLINTWESFIGTPELGIHSSCGLEDERNNALNLMLEKPQLVVDLIALLTLDSLDVKNEIVKHFGKLGISQSVIDEIIDEITDINNFKQGYTTIGKFKDNYYSQEISQEVLLKRITRFEALKTWIFTNCIVLPIDSEHMGHKQFNELESVIGISSYKTILIASTSKRVLLSDDFYLRSIASNEFGIGGIWTQPLLSILLTENILTEEKYNQCILKLICMGYSYTSIDVSLLEAAAEESNWSIDVPFTNTIALLNGLKTDDQTTIGVLVNFIYNLYKKNIFSYQRDALVNFSIQSALTNRDLLVFIHFLRIAIDYRFSLIQSARDKINSILDTYLELSLNPFKIS